MQTITYRVFDPTACAFPAPRVPLLPALTAAAWRSAKATAFTTLGAGRESRHYTRGRYALHDAYRLCGVGPAGALLAPAYHCRTMLDPAIRLGAPILLYGLDAALNADVATIAQCVEQSPTPVRGLLLSHYFGFARTIAPIRAFCDAHDIALIEDCSHAMLVGRGAPQPGDWGRYVTASPYKVFPCEEGGLLLGSAGAPLPSVRRAGPRAECRALLHALQHGWARRDAGQLAATERLDADIERIAKGRIERGEQCSANLAGTSRNYDAREEGVACSLVSRALAGLCDVHHIAQRRRDNYRRWTDAVRGLPRCRPLFGELPDDCVPYMFPLLIDEPDPDFFVLKRLGMPIWRWDDMAESRCEVSQRYRDHLLHLPCHQSLTDRELTWMTSAVAKVMRRALPKAGLTR